jgi:NAD(P)-dependent dehydrogenase (short-subunit alcohol dehydrogenase family)
MGDLVLVTGASTRVGAAAALECSASGRRVVATMRAPAEGAELEKQAKERGLAVAIEQLDVTSREVDAKIRELGLKYGPIYALVNAASEAVGCAFEEQSDAELRLQFETNVLGLMAVTRAVLPMMRAAERGRIVNVSGIAGRVGLPALSVFSATKHAVEGFSEALRWELEPFGIEVCVVEAGAIKSPIALDAERGLRAPELGVPPEVGVKLAAGPYRVLDEAIERLVKDGGDGSPTIEAVGKAVARVVADPSPSFRTGVEGMDARTLVALRSMVPDRLFARGVRRVLGLPRPR